MVRCQQENNETMQFYLSLVTGQLLVCILMLMLLIVINHHARHWEWWYFSCPISITSSWAAANNRSGGFHIFG